MAANFSESNYRFEDGKVEVKINDDPTFRPFNVSFQVVQAIRTIADSNMMVSHVPFDVPNWHINFSVNDLNLIPSWKKGDLLGTWEICKLTLIPEVMSDSNEFFEFRGNLILTENNYSLEGVHYKFAFNGRKISDYDFIESSPSITASSSMEIPRATASPSNEIPYEGPDAQEIAEDFEFALKKLNEKIREEKEKLEPINPNHKRKITFH